MLLLAIDDKLTHSKTYSNWSNFYYECAAIKDCRNMSAYISTGTTIGLTIDIVLVKDVITILGYGWFRQPTSIMLFRDYTIIDKSNSFITRRWLNEIRRFKESHYYKSLVLLGELEEACYKQDATIFSRPNLLPDAVTSYGS